MYFSLVLTLALGVTAVPHHNKAIHEKRDSAPQGWVSLGEADSDIIMPMRIGLTQSNLHAGHDMLMDVSEHDSPNFGKHYTAEEVTEMFAPAKETVDGVIEWLQAEGIQNVTHSVNKQWLAFDANVKTANEVFATKFEMFEHEFTGTRNIGCHEYHVPSHLSEHVDYITPGLRLYVSPKLIKKKNEAIKKRDFNFKIPPIVRPISTGNVETLSVASSCDTYITPNCIAGEYHP